MNSIIKYLLKNPFKNGFFLAIGYAFLLTYIFQKLGRAWIMFSVINQAENALKSAINQHAMPQDLSIACYAAFPILILGIFKNRGFFISLWISWVIFFTILINIIDTELLMLWGSKLNSQAFEYLKYPKQFFETIAPSQWLTIFAIVLFFAFLLWFHLKLFLWVIDKFDIRFNFSPMLLPVVLFLVMGARGGIGEVPLNAANAHFSKNPIENAVATNSVWNVFFYVQQNKTIDLVQKALMSIEIENQALAEYSQPDTFPGGLKRMPQIMTAGSNVLIVILEGINEHWLESDYKHKSMMPNLNRWAQDGMWYKNTYATGDRTDKGLASIFSAWPSQPFQGILLDPQRWKAIKKYQLPNLFASHGYSTQFYYGGDLRFANIKPYLQFVGFDNIPNFILDPALSSKKTGWGIQDKEMILPILNSLKKAKQPFFSAWLTLSSHEPYNVIGDDLITESEKLAKSIQYTDQAIDQLMKGLKNVGLYDSTVVIFVSDHGKTVGLPVTEDYEQEFFRIPLVITGGPIRDMYRGVSPRMIVSQSDIYATLAEQFFDLTDKVPFSRNLFYASHPGMALCFTEGKAVLAASGYRHYLFLNEFQLKTHSDSIVLGLQSRIIRNYFLK